MNQLIKVNQNASSKSVFKYTLNCIFLIILIFITFHILLRNQNMHDLWDIIGKAKIGYILLGLLCMFSNFCFDAFNLRRTLRALGEKVTFMQTLKCTLVGFFFSSITPAATGGQPMQLYLLHKEGVKVSNATLGLILNLFSYQTVTISLAIFSTIFLHPYMSKGMVILFIVGTLINFIALVILTIGIFSHKLSAFFVRVLSNLFKKLKVKNHEQLKERMYHAIDKYNGSAKYIRENRKIITKQFICATMQQFILYSVPFCVLLSLGLPHVAYSKMVGLQAIVFGSTCGIPLPGAVGVSEGAFISLFKPIFTEEFINVAMVLHRGISFYLPVVFCLMVTIYTVIKINKPTKNVKTISTK